MSKKTELSRRDFDFATLVTLFEQTHKYFQDRTIHSINRNLVVRNWLFGYYVVEFEQGGADRAKYGAGLIQELANELKGRRFRGSSISSLKQIRAFYLAHREIGQTLTDQLAIDTQKSQTPSGFLAIATSDVKNVAVIDRLTDAFTLSWSHYVTLLTIYNPEEGSFYEIEASQNNWSVRELDRQINSSLYQRLALSRDKEEIRRLATEGQVVAKAADLIKNPFVLEFLDLDERSSYSERELETAIIDKLQSFLLELGKGFLFETRQRLYLPSKEELKRELEKIESEIEELGLERDP